MSLKQKKKKKKKRVVEDTTLNWAKLAPAMSKIYECRTGSIANDAKNYVADCAHVPYERRTVISSDGVKANVTYSGTVYVRFRSTGFFTSDKSERFPLFSLE